MVQQPRYRKGPDVCFDDDAAVSTGLPHQKTGVFSSIRNVENSLQFLVPDCSSLSLIAHTFDSGL